MNYCHRCECSFEKPGTCNCYAATAQQKPAHLPHPITPAVPERGSYPYPPGLRPRYPIGKQYVRDTTASPPPIVTWTSC